MLPYIISLHNYKKSVFMKRDLCYLSSLYTSLQHKLIAKFFTMLFVLEQKQEHTKLKIKILFCTCTEHMTYSINTNIMIRIIILYILIQQFQLPSPFLAYEIVSTMIRLFSYFTWISLWSLVYKDGGERFGNE